MRKFYQLSPELFSISETLSRNSIKLPGFSDKEDLNRQIEEVREEFVYYGE